MKFDLTFGDVTDIKTDFAVLDIAEQSAQTAVWPCAVFAFDEDVCVQEYGYRIVHKASP